MLDDAIARVLTDNWYRLTRYKNPDQADAAIANVAREIRQELFAGVLPSDCTHARIALELASIRLPGVWDDDQRAALGRVHDALGNLRERLAT